MAPQTASRFSSRGMRHFFVPPVGKEEEVLIRGIGIGEEMAPGLIRRPGGTGDWLLMVFHDPAFVDVEPAESSLQPVDSFMVWPPGGGQFYGNPDCGFRHSWIHCDGGRVRELVAEADVPVGNPVWTSGAAVFEQCLMDIYSEVTAYTRPDLIRIGNLLENGVRGAGRGRAGEMRAEQVPPGLLTVRQLIGEAPSENITLSRMAGLAGMSVPHFSSQFKRYFGIPPVECLIHHRMHKAAHLLGNHRLRINEIALQAGYQDPFHFSKLFKKHHGVSPREYRRRLS